MPGVWQLPLKRPDVEKEERLLDIGGEGRWCLGSHGIFVLDDRAGLPLTIQFYDFATRRTAKVLALPAGWDLVKWGGAFAVSPDEQWAVVTREQIVESDIMLLEGFR